MAAPRYIEGRGYLTEYLVNYTAPNGKPRTRIMRKYHPYPTVGRPVGTRWEPTEEQLNQYRQHKVGMLVEEEIMARMNLKLSQVKRMSSIVRAAN